MSSENKDNELILNPPPLQYKVSHLTKCIFLVIFLAGLFSYIYLIIERRSSQAKFLLDNQMAAASLSLAPSPQFEVHDLMANKDLLLSDEFEGWTLVNLWATWCPACKDEMPSLELLQQNLQGKLKIIALSIDENSDAVKDFITTNKPSFKVLWDKKNISSAQFNVDKYPETFLISPDGKLTTQFSGPRNWGSKIASDYFLNIIKRPY